MPMSLGTDLNRGTSLRIGTDLNIGEGLVGVPGAPTTDALILEDNDYYLLEDLSFILLE